MNPEVLQALQHNIVSYWPLLTAALSLSWFFVWLTGRWLTKAWLRWPCALLIGAIAWIPSQGLPIGSYLSPITGSISLLSIVLMLTSIQIGRERMFPASVWALLLILGIALLSDLFAASPWRLHQWGYAADPSRMGQIVSALVLSLLIFLIAIKRPWLSAICLLPALSWRFEFSPSPNLWENYVDLPLIIVALLGLLSHFGTSNGRQHG
mgnify:CR=1 FL=1